MEFNLTILLFLYLKCLIFLMLIIYFKIKEGGVLIQPFTNLALHGNARINPQIIFKLAGN